MGLRVLLIGVGLLAGFALASGGKRIVLALFFAGAAIYLPSFLLRKAQEREHILEGLRIALDNLDEIIKLIRSSGSRAEAKEKLLDAKFKVLDSAMIERLRLAGTLAAGNTGRLSARQADAILELQLYRLTRLSADEILKELGEIRDQISEGYDQVMEVFDNVKEYVEDGKSKLNRLLRTA